MKSRLKFLQNASGMCLAFRQRMLNGQNWSIWSKIFLVLSFSLSVASCGSGGRVDVDAKNKATAPKKVEEPLNISLKQSIDVVQSITDEASATVALQKLNSKTGGDFAWDRFWYKLSSNLSFLSKFSKETKPQFLALHAKSCKQEHFRAFASFVLAQNDGFEYVIGQKRQCDLALDPELARSYLKKLWKSYDVAETKDEKAVIANTISVLVYDSFKKDTGSSTIWTSTLATLSTGKWRAISETLSKAENANALVNLIHVHEKTLGSAPFIDHLARPLLRNNTVLKNTANRLSTRTVLMILSSTPSFQIEELTKSELHSLLIGLNTIFNPRHSIGNSFEERWENSWKDYALLRSVYARFDRRVDLANALSWLESLQRKLELEFKVHSDRAADFLTYFEKSSLDALWLKARVKGLDSVELFTDLEDYTNRLDQVQYRRLQTHLATNQETKKDLINELCTYFEENGLKKSKRSVSVEQLGFSFSRQAAKPGCHELTVGTEEVVKLPINNLTMAFDSVVHVPDVNLEMSLDAIDGSFIDLSANKTHSDLPMEPTPSSFDAVVFPVVLGFKVQAGVWNDSTAGVYYMITHFTQKFAKDGPASEVTPEIGFPGGSLDVRASKITFSPSFASRGGVGQKGAPRRLGGKSDQSTVTASKVSRWVREENALHMATLKPKGELGVYKKNIRIGALRKLLEVAERSNEDKILVFTNKNYISALPEEQAQKAVNSCKPFELEVCLKHGFGKLAAKQIETDLEAYTDQDEQVVLPRMQTNFIEPYTYTSPKGKLGPVNQDGERGASGVFKIQN